MNHDKQKASIKRILLPMGIITLSVAIMALMIALKPVPKKRGIIRKALLVRTLIINKQEKTVTVHATGTVQPRYETDILPRVSGYITWVHPEFQAGGFFRKGDVFFKIDPMDYKLLEEKSRADVAQAKNALLETQSKATIAKAEWKKRHGDKAPSSPLVLYEPQLKNAEAALASAEADLKQRQLDIRRTIVKAPFNCRVKSQSVAPGRFISAGASAASIAGTNEADIIVPLTIQDLSWLNMTSGNKTPPSNDVAVKLDVGKTVHAWQGYIVRSLGEVDTKGRMVRLLVRVGDPYNLARSVESAVDLSEGLFVELNFKGNVQENVFVIPESALRHDNTIWLYTNESTLDIKKVDVVKKERDTILIRGDIRPGSKLITSPISGAAQGMLLREA